MGKGAAGNRVLPVDENGLNERDRVFVAAYTRHMDGSRAIEEAFPGVYQAPTGHAAYMLARPEIVAEVTRITTERRRRYAIDAERVLREFATIGLADIRDVVEWGENGVKVRPSDQLSPEQAAAISEITETTDAAGKTTVRVKMHPKVPALEALGKHLKLWTNETNVNLLVANLTALPDDMLERRIAELVARGQAESAPLTIEHQPAEPPVEQKRDIFR